MIRVALLTSWDERCGIAEYARNLVANCQATSGDIAFEVHDRRLCSPRPNFEYDILHMNYEPGLFSWLSAQDLADVRVRLGKRLVLTLHTSSDGFNASLLTEVFHRVVVHETVSDGAPKFTHIPMGIPSVDDAVIKSTECNQSLGTFGFPFAWKGFHQVAQAATLLGLGVTVIAPDSRHVSNDPMEACVRDANPLAVYVREWLDQSAVIARLHENLVNVFAYSGGNAGISAACRLGLAAGRPIVLTRCRQFRDLFDYDDEIEFIADASPASIAAGVHRALVSGKLPKRVLEDMSWTRCARAYNDIYRQVLCP